jgi:hypothetical protein
MLLNSRTESTMWAKGPSTIMRERFRYRRAVHESLFSVHLQEPMWL